MSLCDQLIAELDAVIDGVPQINQVVSCCEGRIDGRSTVIDPRLAALRDALLPHATFTPARNVILTPLVGEEPPVVRARAGGWIGQNVSRHNAADDQPEQVEPKR